jgi:hypothetical protein
LIYYSNRVTDWGRMRMESGRVDLTVPVSFHHSTESVEAQTRIPHERTSCMHIFTYVYVYGTASG